MSSVTVRELRDHAGEILERVTRGEAMTVTRNGAPVAELEQLQRHPLSAVALLSRWRKLPRSG